MKTSEACEWLMRLQGDNVPQSEVAAWLDWCNADPRNLEAFDRAQGLYDRLRAVDETVREDFLRLAEEGAVPAAAPVRLAPRWKFAAVGIAAAVCGVAVLWSFRPSQTPAVEHIRYSAEHGGQRDLTLADQSRVVLAGASALSSQYSDTQRLMKLDRGEAYFQVEKDRNRPFVVDAGPVVVTAIGTAFNVRRTSKRTVVSVTEGAVDVVSYAADAPTPVRVQAGQEAVYSPGVRGFVVSAIDPATVTARQGGRFEYLTEPLGSVLEEVNRYAPHPIVAGDDRVRALVFTGTVFRRQAEEWALALDTVFPVSATRREDGSIVLEARPDAAR